MRHTGLAIDEVFGPEGILARKLNDHEYRPSQLEMARAVFQAIEGQHHLCVEAGTGTGKTLAYLIPALCSRKRVIVSTATKNLQDQIFSSDIPFIRENIMPRLAVTYMKGRQNYLCLKRLRDENPRLLPLDGLRDEYRRISEWAMGSETGDRAELEWIEDQDPLWNSLDARSEICVGQKCEYFDRCFVTKMRQRAFESDLVVVNHSLFFASLALESDEIGRILPDFAVLVLDEAHEVEDIAAAHFGKRLSSFQFEELVRDFRRVFPDSRELIDSLTAVESSAQRFFAGFPAEEGRFSLNFYRTGDGSLRDLRVDLMAAYERLRDRMSLVLDVLGLLPDRPSDFEPLYRRVQKILELLDSMLLEDDLEYVHWFERRRRGLFLNATPIDVSPVLRERLFKRSDSVILTSATLTTDGHFGYLKTRLGIPESGEVVVPGEFDYSTQAILYIPGDFPAPRSPEYLLRALRDIREILKISEGHAFLLFTSFHQMNRVYNALAADLPFPLFKQGEMPKKRLLEMFKSTPHSVLCATSSFWQGVDVRGEALRTVIIDKLPFQVPTEPVVAARIQRLESLGENAFSSYTVPDAVITLKQGLGRLIRSRQDRGILAVLDSRLRTRSYGRTFFNSLPNCRVTDNMIELRNFFLRGASPADGGS